MPRIFHVTITKSFDVTIVAESAKEIEKSLANVTDSEFDDWSSASYEAEVFDPLAHIRDGAKVPTKFEEPDMGIDRSGEAVNIYDYAKERPDYMKDVEEEARQVALKLNIDKKVPLLPGF